MTRLELLRRVNGLSQEELGAAIHYSHDVISELERGRRNAAATSRRLRIALEQFFNEPIEQLLSAVDAADLRTGGN